MQETLDFLGRLVLKGCGLTAVHDAFADSLGIRNFFEETRVLGHTFDAYTQPVLAKYSVCHHCPT